MMEQGKITKQICEFKTFVDNSLLGENQKIQIMNIWTETLTELTAEITRRIRKKDPNYKVSTPEPQPI